MLCSRSPLRAPVLCQRDLPLRTWSAGPEAVMSDANTQLASKKRSMRRIAATLAVLASTLAVVRSAIAQEDNAYRVLFLGNSLFLHGGGIHRPFEGFCEAADIECQAVTQHDVVGQRVAGTPVERNGVEYLGFGRVPTRLPDMARSAWIHSMIRSGRFDFVVLDQRRPGYLLPDWVGARDGPQDPYEAILDALVEIRGTIVESGARMVIMAKHAPSNALNWTAPMTRVVERLAADLERIEINGERHPVLVVPTGSLWLDAVNRFGAEAWYEDPRHGNGVAQYASACMVFTYLTGVDPRQSTFTDRFLTDVQRYPESLPDGKVSTEVATWIRDQVWLYYSAAGRVARLRGSREHGGTETP